MAGHRPQSSAASRRMSLALTRLESLLTLSEAMHRSATDQDWNTLIQLGEQQEALREQLPSDLSTRLSPLEQARGRTILERCQQLDAQIRTLVAERQTALRVLLREPDSVT